MDNSSATKRLAVGSIPSVLLTGCGGTGSILAEHLARMIAGFKLETSLTLMDGDTVEEANVWRQNFAAHEVGQNKAVALALRLTGRFGIPVGCVAEFATEENLGDVSGGAMIITATDTLASRKLATRHPWRLWLDVGNEKTFGQAVIGTTHKADRLRRVWWNWGKKKGYVSDLPDIAAINPALLKARKGRTRAGCGRTPFDEQGFNINTMAALAASLLAKQALVDGVVTTAAVYFDTDKGKMAPRGIDRELFAKWKYKEKEESHG